MKQVFYIINEAGEVNTVTTEAGSGLCAACDAMGNLYRTRERAEQVAHSRRTLVKLQRAAALSRVEHTGQLYYLVTRFARKIEITPSVIPGAYGFGSKEAAETALKEIGEEAALFALGVGWLGLGLED